MDVFFKTDIKFQVSAFLSYTNTRCYMNVQHCVDGSPTLWYYIKNIPFLQPFPIQLMNFNNIRLLDLLDVLLSESDHISPFKMYEQNIVLIHLKI